jgi:hypothetical protein
MTAGVKSWTHHQPSMTIVANITIANTHQQSQGNRNL